MRVWDMKTTGGLCTALVGAATVPDLAAALDPAERYVLLPEFTPLQGDWQDALIPMSPGRGTSPVKVTVKRVAADVLLETSAFLELAPELFALGCTALQFRDPPRAFTNYDDERPHARAARYRSAGLTVRFDLPHARESALLTTTDEESLRAALTRLGV
ncbi:hypothetical protein EV193_103517 [Herbihabitans rhizosphaerae]|uniref:Uncharacterized protein n=1 Tax=Herbihabitans rhizosphaerae TaxID=1872711 RepID=A0A4Q7KWY0_9PSEU|nr:hypothetical protein [Herbihabitans rhizosphaerae]RZS41197.1 hypothetical protein EV193_103517 [Herbihabitans rhizosphaerae]